MSIQQAAGTTSVLRVITRLNVGGPARQALLLTRSLAHDFPTLLAAGRPTPAEGELSDPAVVVTHVPLVRPVRPTQDLAAVRSVRQLMVARKIPLVHTHMAKAGAVGRIAARSLLDRPRTVHTFHGHVLEGYFTPRVERAFVESERWLARSTDVLIAVSPEIRDALLDLSIGVPAQYHVVPLGLELDSFLAADEPSGHLRSALGLPPDVPLVGVVGRLVPIKDHATMLRAMHRLDGVHLAVVGDGEMRQALTEQVRAAGLSDRVHFTGWRYDMAATLSDLDVVVLTSRNEGTPAALIEALAARRAVVATDVGGVKAVVVNDETGLLVEPGDEAGIAEKISRLLASPGLRKRLGFAGREHVREHFGERSLVEAIRAVYDGLLTRPPAR